MPIDYENELNRLLAAVYDMQAKIKMIKYEYAVLFEKLPPFNQKMKELTKELDDITEDIDIKLQKQLEEKNDL